MCVHLYAMEMVYVLVTVNKLTVSFIHLYWIFVSLFVCFVFVRILVGWLVRFFEWAIVQARRKNDELSTSDHWKSISFKPIIGVQFFFVHFILLSNNFDPDATSTVFSSNDLLENIVFIVLKVYQIAHWRQLFFSLVEQQTDIDGYRWISMDLHFTLIFCNYSILSKQWNWDATTQ